MYGDNVHAAVVEAKEKLSGITLHEVNAEFDKGKVLAQFSTPVEGAIDSLKQNIAELEMQWFPRTIEAWILSNRLS
jgi:phosphoribosylglycinamide formyltransferase-1